MIASEQPPPDEPIHLVAPTQAKDGKNKALAIVLSVLVSYFSWFYTWKFDAWKFWACLVIDATLALLAGFVWSTVAAEAIVIWVSSGLWLLLAIVDQARKPDDYWHNYRLRPKTKLTAKRLGGRLALIAAVAAPLIVWQLAIRSQPADFDVEVLSFECNIQTVDVRDILAEEGFRTDYGSFCRLDFKLTNPTAKLQSHLNSESPPFVSALLPGGGGPFVVDSKPPVEYYATTVCDYDYPHCCSISYLAKATDTGCRSYFNVPLNADLGQPRLQLLKLEGDAYNGGLEQLEFYSSPLDID